MRDGEVCAICAFFVVCDVSVRLGGAAWERKWGKEKVKYDGPSTYPSSFLFFLFNGQWGEDWLAEQIVFEVGGFGHGGLGVSRAELAS